MSSEHSDDKQKHSGDEEDDAGHNVLDPRVKGELDRLNTSTAEINRLEKELEEVQETFRQTLSESAIVLKSESNFLGRKCVEQARPYYDAVQKAKEIQMETQKIALKFERACSVHQSAKEVLARAENKFVSTATQHKILDSPWQEMLNQAIQQVADSEQERRKVEQEHCEIAIASTKVGKDVAELKMKLKSAINRSRSYFELKETYMETLQVHKKHTEVLQESIQKAKKDYSLSLKSLEEISDEIHELRRSREDLRTRLSAREDGVGAESPALESPYEATREVQKHGTSQHSFGFKIAIVRTKSDPKTNDKRRLSDNGVSPRRDSGGLSSFDTEVEPTKIQVPRANVSQLEMGGHWPDMTPGAPGPEFNREVEGACVRTGGAGSTGDPTTTVAAAARPQEADEGEEAPGTPGGRDGSQAVLNRTEAMLDPSALAPSFDAVSGIGEPSRTCERAAEQTFDEARADVDTDTLEVAVSESGGREAAFVPNETEVDANGTAVDPQGITVFANRAKSGVKGTTPGLDKAKSELETAKAPSKNAALDFTQTEAGQTDNSLELDGNSKDVELEIPQACTDGATESQADEEANMAVVGRTLVSVDGNVLGLEGIKANDEATLTLTSPITDDYTTAELTELRADVNEPLSQMETPQVYVHGEFDTPQDECT